MLGLWELSLAPRVTFSCSSPRQSGFWVPIYGCSKTTLAFAGVVKAQKIPSAAVGAGAQMSHVSHWSPRKSMVRTLKGAGAGDLHSFTHSAPLSLPRCYASSEHVLEIQATNKQQGMLPTLLSGCRLLYFTVP